MRKSLRRSLRRSLRKSLRKSCRHTSSTKRKKALKSSLRIKVLIVRRDRRRRDPTSLMITTSFLHFSWLTFCCYESEHCVSVLLSANLSRNAKDRVCPGAILNTMFRFSCYTQWIHIGHRALWFLFETSMRSVNKERNAPHRRIQNKDSIIGRMCASINEFLQTP